MTSTIFISKNIHLTPKQGVVETIFKQIQTEILAANELMLAGKLDYAIQARIGDFSGLSAEDFQTLMYAAKRTLYKWKNMSAESLGADNEDELFEVLFVFLQFYIVLYKDPRITKKTSKGIILVNNLNSWKNEDWICELIVIGIAIYTRTTPDWNNVVSVKSKGNLLVYDLSEILLDKQSLVLQAVQYLQSYFNGKAYLTNAKEIIQTTPPTIRAFYEFLEKYSLVTS
jgi:hypothetical protein